MRCRRSGPPRRGGSSRRRRRPAGTARARRRATNTRCGSAASGSEATTRSSSRAERAYPHGKDVVVRREIRDARAVGRDARCGAFGVSEENVARDQRRDVTTRSCRAPSAGSSRGRDPAVGNREARASAGAQRGDDARGLHHAADGSRSRATRTPERRSRRHRAPRASTPRPPARTRATRKASRTSSSLDPERRRMVRDDVEAADVGAVDEKRARDRMMERRRRGVIGASAHELACFEREPRVHVAARRLDRHADLPREHAESSVRSRATARR